MLNWNNSLNTGIPIIDNQHRKILSQINKLIELVNSGRSLKEVENSLDKLEEYVNSHNNTEENFMRRYNYKDINDHIYDHKVFNKNISIIKTAVSKDADRNKLKEVFKAQSDSWFSNHIISYDKKMAEYLKKFMK